MQQFKLTISNHAGEQQQLTWQLLDHTIVNKWRRIMNLSKPVDLNCQYDWWGVGYAQEHLDSIWARMQTIVQHINLYENAGVDESLLQDRSRSTLNTLHKEFHLLAENVVSSAEVNQLNYLVHNAETCINNITHGLNYGSFNTMLNNFYREPLEEQDFELFDCYSPVVGDLTVGYSTIGKNLVSCYFDKDMEIIQTGMVRPKIEMSTEIRVLLGSQDASKVAGEGARIKEQYYNWCDENQVLEKYGYDCRAPLHTGGVCVLGKAVNFDPAELNEWAINSNSIQFVSWDFE